ncbi:hypothetical protein K2X33_14160, partial [bacterium]|nr:hypothetical protein [bacterium]
MRFIALFLTVAFSVYAGESPRFYDSAPLLPAPVTDQLCGLLLETYGEPLLQSKPLEIHVVEEGFDLSGEEGPFKDHPFLKELAPVLVRSRRQFGQRNPHVDNYDRLNSAVFAVRTDEEEFRLRLSVAPKAPTEKKQRGVLVLTPVQNTLVLMADGRFPLDPFLMGVTEEHPSVKLLEAETLAKVVPAAVLERIQGFSLQEELLNLPHDTSLAHMESPNNLDINTRYMDPGYFLVLDPQDKAPIGYLVTQDFLITYDTDDYSAGYRRHFQPGPLKTNMRERFLHRHRAHFDLHGNRMELWPL